MNWQTILWIVETYNDLDLSTQFYVW